MTIPRVLLTVVVSGLLTFIFYKLDEKDISKGKSSSFWRGKEYTKWSFLLGISGLVCFYSLILLVTGILLYAGFF